MRRGGKEQSMLEVILKRFEQPDEIRTFEKGRVEVVRLGGMTIGRASDEPGWKWSEHVGRAARAKSCAVEHVGMVISGRATAAMDDGRVFEMKAGDVFYIAPGHDSWVVGDKPYVRCISSAPIITPPANKEPARRAVIGAPCPQS